MTGKILLIGLDQVGSTLGLALSRTEGEVLRLGFDPEKKLAKAAKSANAIDRVVAHPRQAIESADLIIFSLPHHETEAYLESLGPKMKPDAVIIDTGLIKAPFFRWAEQHLPADRAYIGATPVLGEPIEVDEEADSISADRFSGGVLAITAPVKTPERAMGIAINLAKLLGAQPFFIDVDEQDATAAITEDLPVLVSAALMQSGAGSQSWREIQRLAGRAYANATEPCAVDSKQLQRRIAANHEKVLARLDAFSNEIEQIKQMLVAKQEEALIQYFDQANRARSGWLNARARGDWAGDELPKVPDVDTSLMRQLLGLGKRRPKTE